LKPFVREEKWEERERGEFRSYKKKLELEGENNVCGYLKE